MHVDETLFVVLIPIFLLVTLLPQLAAWLRYSRGASNAGSQAALTAAATWVIETLLLWSTGERWDGDLGMALYIAIFVTVVGAVFHAWVAWIVVAARQRNRKALVRSAAVFVVLVLGFGVWAYRDHNRHDWHKEFRALVATNPEVIRPVMAAALTDEDLAHLKHATALRDLYLGDGAQISWRGLANIPNPERLEKLNVWNASLGDAGSEILGRFTNLQELDLSITKVGDATMRHVATLSALQHLRIGYTATTDASIESLVRLTALQTLDLSGTKVSPAGHARLRAALPSCKITGGPRP